MSPLWPRPYICMSDISIWFNIVRYTTEIKIVSFEYVWKLIWRLRFERSIPAKILWYLSCNVTFHLPLTRSLSEFPWSWVPDVFKPHVWRYYFSKIVISKTTKLFCARSSRRKRKLNYLKGRKTKQTCKLTGYI